MKRLYFVMAGVTIEVEGPVPYLQTIQHCDYTSSKGGGDTTFTKTETIGFATTTSDTASQQDTSELYAEVAAGYGMGGFSVSATVGGSSTKSKTTSRTRSECLSKSVTESTTLHFPHGQWRGYYRWVVKLKHNDGDVLLYLDSPSLCLNSLQEKNDLEDAAQPITLTGKKVSKKKAIATVSSDPLGGRTFKLQNQWSGRDEWVSFTDKGKCLRAIYNKTDAMPVKLHCCQANSTYKMENRWSGQQGTFISFRSKDGMLCSGYSKDDAMPIKLTQTKPSVYKMQTQWTKTKEPNWCDQYISFSDNGTYLYSRYSKESDAMPIKFVPVG